MQELSLKWFALLLVSTSVLIWRLIDFTDEAVNQAFHMTRGSLNINGAEAEVLQLILIFVTIAFIWNSIANLVRLHLTNPSK